MRLGAPWSGYPLARLRPRSACLRFSGHSNCSTKIGSSEPRRTNNLRSESAFDHGSLRLLGHLFSHLCARKECSAEFRGAGSIACGKISYRANSTLVYRQDVLGKRLELS
jgi:hypothetical protein